MCSMETATATATTALATATTTTTATATTKTGAEIRKVISGIYSVYLLC